MPAAASMHPSADQLRAFAHGRLSASAMADVESHVANCDECCRQLQNVPDDTLVQLAREAATFGFRQELSQPATQSPPAIPPELAEHPRYRVLSLVGTGGMGAVYKAEHRLMERLVALKVINPTFLKNAAAVERFHREFKSAARLSHPNVVTAHDAERAGNLHFLVMEFVEGLPLDRLVEQAGPLPVARACHVIHQAALGLQHAHERGMVHRDIKPQNLMVGRKGQVKVLDFGLARLAADEDTSSTTEGMILGTPDYIAPEQAANARSADIRSDIYSLGGTLYFALTGQPPFPKGSFVEKLTLHATREPEAIRSLRPDVPAELAEVLARMMAKDPSRRYQTPSEAAKDLAPFVRERKATQASARRDETVSGGRKPAEIVNSPSITPLNPPAEPAPLVEPLGNLSLAAATPLRPAVKASEPRFSLRLWRVLAAAAICSAALLTLMLAVPFFVVWLGKDSGTSGTPAPIQRGPIPSVPLSRQYRALMVIPTTGLYGPDYFNTVNALREANVKVQVAALTDNPSTFKNQSGEPGPTRTVPYGNNLSAENYDFIIFTGYETYEFTPGGDGVDTTRRLINEFQQDGKLVTAICRGQQVLAEHGALKGKQVARCQYVDPSAYGADQQFGGQVAADGRIVTAAADRNAQEFVTKIVEVLAGK
jgi:eukaryotic-like serine/threonine-protein kinase